MSALSNLSKKILVASVYSCLVTSTVIVSSLALFTPLAQAQSRRVRYVPPSNLDAPIVSSSGITRSNIISREAVCGQFACVIVLVPDLNLESSPVPKTLSENPTIYILSPQINDRVYFELLEASTKESPKAVYKKTFYIKNEAGVIAFKMPSDAPKLEIGKIYIYQFRVGFNSYEVRGTVQRVLPNPKLVDQLQKTSQPLERAQLFAQEGIWYETVQTLAEAQLTVPKNVEVLDEWTDLLKSAKLDRVLPYSFVLQK